MRKYGHALEELYLKSYPSDALLSPGKIVPWFEFYDRQFDAGAQITEDIWGCKWRRISDADTDAGMLVKAPLEDLRCLEDYSFPDPLEGVEGVGLAKREIARDRHQHYTLGAVGMLWQRLNFLRGFANSLMDTIERSDAFFHLRDRILDHLLMRIECWQEVGVDGILIWDDWGTQQELMISPKSWRDLFKESYRTLVEKIHSGGTLAHLHTDGNTTAIIGDLIEIGFDELNPQISCMDMAGLGRDYGGRVCFRPDLDRQRVLPRGSAEDVEAHVRAAYENFGRSDGGYIGYTGTSPDISLENIEVMLQTFRSLGD